MTIFGCFVVRMHTWNSEKFMLNCYYLYKQTRSQGQGKNSMVSRCVVRPKKPAHHTMSILAGRNKTWFSHLCSSQISYHLLQRCPPGRQVYIPNLMQIAPAVLFKRPKFHLNFFIFSYTLLRVSVVLLNRLY